MIGVLAVAVGIGVSIALHEVGHLLPAKRFGVPVRQYMVGFGPTVWSRRRAGTEYGIKAIPLGGYVRMIGMLPPRAGDDPHRLRSSSTGRFSQMADQARADSMEEIRPGEQNRVFYKLPVAKKVLVMLGGPMVNLVIGVVLITAYLTLYGAPDPGRPLGSSVVSVSPCVPAAPGPAGQPGSAADAEATCAGRGPSPAAAAGLRVGDRIVAIGGQRVDGPSDLARIVRQNVGVPLSFEVQRDGATVNLGVTPAQATVTKLDTEGNPVRDPATGAALTERAGFVGVTQRETWGTSPLSVAEVPGVIGRALGQMTSVIVQLPQKLVNVWQSAFGTEERDPNGPVSVVGVGRVAGEKAGGQVFGSIVDDIPPAWFIVQLLAMLNFALFLFNLIPLMPLDGGHVAGALWEGVRRQVARIRGRPDPGPVDVARFLPVAYVVSIVLISMAGLLIYADLVRPIKL